MKVDPTSRSDMLLLNFGSYHPSEAHIICGAVLVWWKLVGHEKHLKKKKTENPDPSTEARDEIRNLQIDCNEMACELKDLYNKIVVRLPSVPEMLSIPIQRLEKDYSGVFKSRGL